MNHISSGLFGIASLIVAGSIVLGGCGLRDINDPVYSEQNKDFGIDNAEDKMPPPLDEKTKALMRNQQQQPMAGNQQPPMEAQQPPAMPQGQGAPQGSGASGCPVSRARQQPSVAQAPAPAAPAPAPATELDPAFVREPDLVNPLPDTVENTNEVRPVSRVVNHYREIWRPQNKIRIHNIDRPYTERHRYRQKIINAPTVRTIITTTGSTNFVQEVLPNEVVTLPLVDYGTVFGWF